jgi:hypothetical protein
MLDRLSLLIGLTLLAIAVLLGSIAIGRGIRDRGHTQVVTVTGSAKEQVASDFAIWDLSVSSQQSAAAGAAKELAAWTEKIRAFLTAQGIQPDEVTVQPVSTQAVNATDNGGNPTQVIGYTVTRNFEVRSARVGAVASTAEASAKLIAAGVPLQAQPLQYVLTKLSDLRPKLLADAVRDAQNRGKILVEASGAKLGKLRDVQVGVFQITSPNSTEVSDYGVYDTSTLNKDVTAVVNVTFALK